MAVFSAGADWCTLTNVLQDNQEKQSLMGIFLEMSQQHTKWKAGGYKGKQDIGGMLKFGSRVRKDGQADELLVSSAAQADKTIDTVHDLIAYHCTRLDLQVTMQLDNPSPKLSSDMYDELRLQKSLGGSPTGRRKFSHIRSDTGDTLYIGTRKTGRKFFRFYDKSNDLGVEKGLLWRVEVQYGNDLADKALQTYVGIRKDRQALIDLVSSEFYDASGFNVIEGVKVDAEIISESEQENVTAQRKLDWLATCVRPTIAFLFEQDLEGEVMDALGIRRLREWKIDDTETIINQTKH